MNIQIQENINIAELTTFKIGGNAKFFLKVTTKAELIAAINWSKKNNEKIYILGGGSNVLVDDQGIDGLVIQIANNKLRIRENNTNQIEVSGGTKLFALVNFAKDNLLSGLEWATGIPGSIGGAIRGNAGAYGGEMKDVVIEVEVFDLDSLDFKVLNNKECNFKYRDSIVKQNNNLIIWNIIIELKKEDQEKIKEKMNEYNQKRKARLPKYPSAGCIFKNLFLEEIEKSNPELFKEIINTIDLKGNKNHKIGCGYVIDKLGLKNKQIGGAKVSEEHANFVINVDNATAKDVKELIEYIKKEAKDKLNIDLEEEVQYIGAV